MEVEHTINLKDKQGYEGGPGPSPVLSAVLSRWDRPVPVLSHLLSSWCHAQAGSFDLGAAARRPVLALQQEK
ncbi:MAG: hypothetical protein KAS32_06665 [Candidatus Peribacteraceae bacterium]|nr:hypothetical protein [Candidatus Peribacteraceae bacterium]